MLRAQLALAVIIINVLVTFGLRMLINRRRYGDTGWRFHRANTLGGTAQLLLSSSVMLLVAAPAAALLTEVAHGPLGIAGLTRSGSAAATISAGLALLLIAVGVGVVWVAQREMGASWRIGLDASERTALVTHGLFRWARNPIFTGMAVAGLGHALLVPNVLSIVAIVTAVTGLQLQVRAVEEPYLRAQHGQAYLRWASTTGRFLPYLGQLKDV